MPRTAYPHLLSFSFGLGRPPAAMRPVTTLPSQIIPSKTSLVQPDDGYISSPVRGTAAIVPVIVVVLLNCMSFVVTTTLHALHLPVMPAEWTDARLLQFLGSLINLGLAAVAISAWLSARAKRVAMRNLIAAIEHHADTASPPALGSSCKTSGQSDWRLR